MMRYRRYSKPEPRTIVVRFAGKCACCGQMIAAGETATYYPPGTIAGVTEGRIGHIGGLSGESTQCAAELRKWHEQRAVNDFAGDGLDARYEDQCGEICGR